MKKEKLKIEDKKEKEKIELDEKSNKNKENIYHKYLCYLIIFSIIGLFLETIFCLVAEKLFNREAGLILGPLCIVYGIGTIITIICLNRFKGHKIKLFILGAVLGVTVEYVMGFILESTFGARLWNCSWSKFNVNERICLEHAVLWGILTVIVIELIKKYIDMLINKIKGKTRIIVDIISTAIIVLLLMLTIWGVITYTTRAREILNGKNYTSNNNIIEKFQNTVFSNEIMEKIFSKIEIIDNEGNTVLIKNING